MNRLLITLDILSGGMSNITVRGVSPTAYELRPQIKIIEGRNFTFGSRELIVGESIAKKFKGAQVGESIKSQVLLENRQRLQLKEV
jgi:ABC-type lipoprotein release transport system permease subunit